MSWGGSDSGYDSGSLFRNERFEFSRWTDLLCQKMPNLPLLKNRHLFFSNGISHMKERVIQFVLEKNIMDFNFKFNRNSLLNQ